jgi:hypothetical protein
MLTTLASKYVLENLFSVIVNEFGHIGELLDLEVSEYSYILCRKKSKRSANL